MLFDFIAELRKNPKLQSDFLADPEGVMCKEGLTDEEKEIVRSRDQKRIMDTVVQQVEDVFKGTEKKLAWIPIEVRVTSISPRSGRRGQEVLATINGAFFPLAPGVALEQGDVRVVGNVESVEDGDRARITARFSLGAAIPVGRYDVVVLSGENEEARLPGAFTVRA